nr:unnamed protein product [Digitaria exilis]
MMPFFRLLHPSTLPALWNQALVIPLTPKGTGIKNPSKQQPRVLQCHVSCHHPTICGAATALPHQRPKSRPSSILKRSTPSLERRLWKQHALKSLLASPMPVLTKPNFLALPTSYTAAAPQ